MCHWALLISVSAPRISPVVRSTVSVVKPIALEASSYGHTLSRKMMTLLCPEDGTSLQSTSGKSSAVMLGGPPGQGAEVHASNAWAAIRFASAKGTYLLAAGWKL